MEGRLSRVSGSLKREIAVIRKKMYDEREKRSHPGLDDKILVNWNALMLYSFALAYGITTKERFYEAAINNAELLWNKCFVNNTLMHSYKNGITKIEGYLDDYSFLSEAFIMLYEVTADEKWLRRADTLMNIVIEKFYNRENSDFYYTSNTVKNLIVRTREYYDNAIPSGNSSAVFALLKLSILSNNPEFSIIASNVIGHFHDVILRYPESFAYLLTASYFKFITPKEIAVIAEDDRALKSLTKEFFNEFLPITVFTSRTKAQISALEIMKGKKLVKAPYTIFVCQNFTCQMPVFSMGELMDEVSNKTKMLRPDRPSY